MVTFRFQINMARCYLWLKWRAIHTITQFSVHARMVTMHFCSSRKCWVSTSSTLTIAQIPLGSSRHDSTRHVRRVEFVETERVEPCCSTSSTQPKCMGSTRRTCRVVTYRDVTWRAKWNVGLHAASNVDRREGRLHRTCSSFIQCDHHTATYSTWCGWSFHTHHAMTLTGRQLVNR